MKGRVMGDQFQSIDQIKASAIDMVVKFGPKLVVATAILAVGDLVGRWVGRMLDRLLVKLMLEAPVRSLLTRVAHLIVFGLFGIMALQNLGVELLPLIAGLGVAGAGIALAMQGVLSNLVAGLVIIVTRPFRVGDYISIVKEEGVVTDIRLANTTLSHADLSRVVIPNRRIVGEILHNYGEIRQLQVEVRVGHDADLGEAFAALEEVLRADSRVLKDPAPVLKVAALTDSAVIVGAYPWTRVADYGAAAGDVTRAVVEAFRARGIVIPPPQREVRMLQAAYWRKELYPDEGRKSRKTRGEPESARGKESGVPAWHRGPACRPVPCGSEPRRVVRGAGSARHDGRGSEAGPRERRDQHRHPVPQGMQPLLSWTGRDLAAGGCAAGEGGARRRHRAGPGAARASGSAVHRELAAAAGDRYGLRIPRR